MHDGGRRCSNCANCVVCGDDNDTMTRRLDRLTDPKVDGVLAKMKTDVRTLIDYTDVTVSEVLGGDMKPKELFAVRCQLHQYCFELQRLIDAYAELRNQ